MTFMGGIFLLGREFHLEAFPLRTSLSEPNLLRGMSICWFRENGNHQEQAGKRRREWQLPARGFAASVSLTTGGFPPRQAIPSSAASARPPIPAKLDMSAIEMAPARPETSSAVSAGPAIASAAGASK